MTKPVVAINVLASELTDVIDALTFKARAMEKVAKARGNSKTLRADLNAIAERLYALAGRLDNDH